MVIGKNKDTRDTNVFVTDKPTKILSVNWNFTFKIFSAKIPKEIKMYKDKIAEIKMASIDDLLIFFR